MKRRESKEVYAVVELGWDRKYYMPIEEAQIVQRLLAKASKIKSEYVQGDRSFCYLVESSLPPVVEREHDALFDASEGMTEKQADEWAKDVKSSLSNNSSALLEDVMTPEQWLKVRG